MSSVKELDLPERNGRVDAPDRPRTPKVLSVLSAKTGSGGSFIAANLAVLLARGAGERVVLVDLNFLSGDLAVMFQLRPKMTVIDVADQNHWDGETLAAHLSAHPSGVSLLAAPLDGTSSPPSARKIRRLLAGLRESSTFVVADVTTAFPDQTLAAIEESDEVVLVGSLDVPSAKNLVLSLSRLGELGFTRERVTVVLNRANSHVGLTVADVEKALRSKIDVTIPSSREVPASINEGLPLATSTTRSPVFASLERLALALGGKAAPTGRRWFLR
jgi:pilus assembly protein CpaE